MVFHTSAVTVRRAVSREGRSSRLTTWGFRRARGPLSLRYTSPHNPMFLSGGVGFQSTHMKARSWGSGPTTATATAFASPGRTSPLTSSSCRRNAPTTSSDPATRAPLSQTVAR